METVVLQTSNHEDLDMFLLLAKRLNCNAFQSFDESIKVPIEILQNKEFSIQDLQLEFSIYLYEKNLLTLEQGSKLSNIDILSFQKELGKRKISMHYDIPDFEQDIQTLKKLNRI
jgi:predicted HTH domain antitoxin